MLRPRHSAFVLFGLILVAGIFISPTLLVVHLVADIALAGYVWMLVSHRQRALDMRSTAMRRDRYGAPQMMRRRASGS